jgi:hypothetical protein
MYTCHSCQRAATGAVHTCMLCLRLRLLSLLPRSASLTHSGMLTGH